ncbi:monovalent cation/H+ antiporter complex subunit F [Ovoidimarina sediminis]|uniref:monovalent cation/H+ antiporter complex subunit F n=1 Tax=Ovoidimarina sediminis TaxID=3079856 RepID=UPI002907A56D|nr:monovalent cation/H+ antiporter complex subunit F [Rhodophyticola sp. MJ-SS7]MDU8944832.1 monovalent cation/H+ antiporter complex subunit F [Rhodophyticola sp. MJ-SS7]
MTEFLELSVTLGFVMVFLAVGLALWRLAKGPSLPDRVVALDMMTVAIVAFCGLAAVRSGDAAFLDVALVLALVGFLATVALARFAERQTIRREEREGSE